MSKLLDYPGLEHYNEKVQGQISQLGQEVNLELHGETEVYKDYVWTDGYVTSPGKINSSTTSKFCQPILFKAGETLSYKTGTTYGYAVVEVADDTALEIGDSGFVEEVLVAANTANQTYTYTFTENKYVVITCQKASNTIAVSLTASDSYDDKLDEKVDKVIGSSLIPSQYIQETTSPEFLHVITDSNEQVLMGIRGDGDVVFGVGVPSEIKKYVDEANGDSNDETIREWLGLFKQFEVAPVNSTILTIDEVSVGDTLRFSFTTTTSNGGIGFYNSSDERLEWIGGGNGEGIGYKYNGPATIPTGFSYAKVIWGTLNDLTICKYTNPSELMEDLRMLKGGVKSYFVDEMDATVETVLAHTKSPAVVLPILTDSHWGLSARNKEQAWETIENVKCLCESCYCDGIIHLGDILMSSWNSYLLGLGKTQSEVNVITSRMISEYINHYASAHPKKHLYAVGGNHDGDSLQTFKYDKWYSIIGREENDDPAIIKEGLAPYFYVDFEKCNLRCIFLQQPNDYDNGGVSSYGYTSDMLEWLVSEALDVTDGVHIMMFSHIPPFQASYITDGVLPNRSSFYGVCGAFNGHTTFSDSVVSCDFSGLSTSKILAYACGHTHGDAIYEPGESYTGTAYVNGSTVEWTFTNGMPCPVVIITNTYVGNSGDGSTRNGDCGTYHVPRADFKVTQDAWDTFLYNPTEKKIIFIRFGSGNDRVIDLSETI